MAKKRITIPDDLSGPDCHARLEEIAVAMAQLTDDETAAREVIRSLSIQRGRLQSEQMQLENRLRSLKQKPSVSDHAIVRYLERKYGFDIDAIREEILSPPVKDAMKAGASGFKSENGTFKIADMTIVTIF